MDPSTEDILDRVRRRKQECAQLLESNPSSTNPSNDENRPGDRGAARNSAEEPQQKSPLKSALKSPRKEAAEKIISSGSSSSGTTRSKTTTFSECAMPTPGGGDDERRTLRRSKFAELSAQNEEFESELKREKSKQGSAAPPSKEQLVRGPQKRISMGGETRASVLFAPQDPVYKSPEKRLATAGVDKSPMRNLGSTTPTATTPKKEVGKSPIAAGSEGKQTGSTSHLFGHTASPKPYIATAAPTTPSKGHPSPGPLPRAKTESSVVVSAEEDVYSVKHSDDVESAGAEGKRGADSVGDGAGDLDSSSEYGIHMFGQRVERRADARVESGEEVEQRQAPQQLEQPPTPKRRTAPQSAVKSPNQHSQQPPIAASGETRPTSTARTPVTPSVKSLRNRWEVSSATGTPLHPDSSNEELLNTALGMAAVAVATGGGGRQAVKRNFQLTKKPTYQQIMDEVGDSGGGSKARVVEERKAINSPAPKSARIHDNSNEEEEEAGGAAGAVVEEADLSEDGARAGQRTPSPGPHAWSVVAGDFKTPLRDGGAPPPHRPVTPNHELLGSLLEEIDRDLRHEGQFSQPGDGDARAQGASPERLGGNEGLHTISNYRLLGSAKRQQQAHTSHHSESPLATMAHSPIKTLSFESVDGSPAPLHALPSNEATLKRLHEAIVVQQDQICQASRALAFCRQNELFRARGSREEVDAQRALLIATERRRAYWNERERIMARPAAAAAGDGSDDAGIPRGTLTFSYIAVRLSRDFINAYCQQGPQESQLYYLLVLIKHSETVLHTTLASSDEGLKNGFVEFSHYIQLAGLLPNFQCTVEVYALRAIRPLEHHGKKKGGTWKRIIGATPIGGGGGAGASSIFGPSGGPIGVVDPGFQKVGSLRINRSLVGAKNKFLLSDTLYPLDGQLMLQMRCFAEPASDASADRRGFLSLYQVVSGLGAWTRFWALLHDGQMRFWQYPEDEEKGRGPAVVLSLNKCLTKATGVTASAASFPHSIQVDVAIGEGDAPKEEIRMLFAADTREEMDKWMRAINEAIRNCHMWSTA